MTQDLASKIENDLYKVKGMVGLCMDALGHDGNKDDIETVLWAAHDLLKIIEENFAAYDHNRFLERKEYERENEVWEKFASEWNDDGEMELAVQDSSGENPYAAVFQKVKEGKSSSSATMKKGKKK